MKVLITGSLGFIGYHLTNLLIQEGFDVVGIDNINDYYDVRLKTAKLPLLGIAEQNPVPEIRYESTSNINFHFYRIDITKRNLIDSLFKREKFDYVIHLAAQAGVQYSIENPHTYVDTNLVGFINVMDACRMQDVKHFVYASSSSVYGDREEVPFSEDDRVDYPISMYAATKKANELMAYSYSHLFHLKTTGLRFFTVYGPWGRPDMAPYIFMSRILSGQPIEVFNQGNLERDFTYVSDIVRGIRQVLNQKTVYEVYNIGNSSPVNLKEFISTLEDVLGVQAIINYRPMRIGDVHRTYSDVSKLKNDFGYRPATSVREGLSLMADWYKNLELK
jgi:UDP-glucuronate 4-epimerase